MAKIFIIGMPGSGKSTIGKELALILKYDFIDTDNEIERTEGATIKAIFELKGEDYFRQIESQVLSKVTKKEVNLVVATGGGAPCFYSGLEYMKANGETIFIDITVPTLIERVKVETSRPLLNEGAEQKINELYNQRISTYTKADIIIKADNLSLNDLVKRIYVELKDKN